MRRGRLEVVLWPNHREWRLSYRGLLVWSVKRRRGNRVLWLGPVQILWWIR